MNKFIEKFSNCYLVFCIYSFIGWIYEVLYFFFLKHKFINRGLLFGPFLPIYGFGMLLLIYLLKTFILKKHKASNIFYLTISISTIITFVFISIIEYKNPFIKSITELLNEYGLLILIINIIGIILGIFIVKKMNSEKINNLDLTVILIFLFIWIIATALEFSTHLIMDTFFNKELWDYSKNFLNINGRVDWDASRGFAFGGTFLLYIIQPLIHKILLNIKDSTKATLSFLIGTAMIIDLLIQIIK